MSLIDRLRRFLLRIARDPRVLLVAWHVALLAALYTLQRHRIFIAGSSWVPSAAVLLALLWGEWRLTRAFELAPEGVLARRAPKVARVVGAAGLAARSAVLCAAVWILVEAPARLGPGDSSLFLKGLLPQIWGFIPITLAATPWASVVAVGAWLAVVELVVVRARLLRATLGILAPALLFYGLVFANYDLWFSDRGVAAVGSDSGVEVVFDPLRLADPELREVWRHPRRLLVDETGGTAFVSFGRTLASPLDPRPNLWKIDLRTGTHQQLPVEGRLRVLEADGSGGRLYSNLFANSTWLAIDAATLRVREQIDMKPVLDNPNLEIAWALASPPFIHVAVSGMPALLAFDTRTSTFSGRLDLYARGILGEAAKCCTLATSKATGRLFAAGHDTATAIVLRFPPGDLREEASFRLPMPEPYWLAVREAEPQLFVGEEFGGSVWRMQQDGSDARRILSGQGAQARLFYDDQADRLLIGDYSRGVVRVVTPDGQVERVYQTGPKPAAVVPRAQGVWVLSARGILLLRR